MPNIHETIKQLSIEAGGPGSGRKPGSESGFNKKLITKHALSNMYDRGPALSKDEENHVVEHISKGNVGYDEDEGNIVTKSHIKHLVSPKEVQIKSFKRDVKEARSFNSKK